MLSTPSKTSETILVLVLACIVAYFWSKNMACLQVALVLGAIAVFVPSLADFIARYWLKFGTILGTINGKIILSIVYFLFLVPIALLRRLFSKQVKIQDQRPDSMFVTRNHTYCKADLENMW